MGMLSRSHCAATARWRSCLASSDDWKRRGAGGGGSSRYN